MNKIFASIIIYYPDYNRLYENLKQISKQVNKVLLINNSADNNKLCKVLNKFNNVILINNKKNFGVAKALNQILDYGNKNGYTWVLTLDQDSIVTNNIINIYYKYTNIDNIAMITCKIIDRNTGKNNEETYSKIRCVKKCITSGCLNKIGPCLKIGGFDEKMFIDYVDFDMNIRLIKEGYKILQIPFYGVLHETGKAKSLKILNQRVKINNNYVDLYNESPIRVFYFFRNTVYFIRKHKVKNHCYTSPIHICWRALLIILFEDKKLVKVKMILKGIYQGLKLNLEN